MIKVDFQVGKFFNSNCQHDLVVSKLDWQTVKLNNHAVMMNTIEKSEVERLPLKLIAGWC